MGTHLPSTPKMFTADTTPTIGYISGALSKEFPGLIPSCRCSGMRHTIVIFTASVLRSIPH